MNYLLRPLILTISSFLIGSGAARAQFVELVTEAPVTLSAAITTATITSTATERKSVTTKITQATFLEELRTANIITTPTITGWSLVAARSAPADVAFVSADFELYAVNPTYPAPPGTRIAVPANKFKSQSFSAVGKYTEKHQGQYVFSSKGIITKHIGYDWRPDFKVGTKSFSMQSSLAEGFATINYISKDFDGNYEIFFYAISSMKSTAIGSFTVAPPTPADSSAPTVGLVAITVNVGAARLVPRSSYPAAAFFP